MGKRHTGNRLLRRNVMANRAIAIVTSAALVACTAGLPVGAGSIALADEPAAGELTVSAAGLSAQDTMVDLYRVAVTGGIGGTIGVDDVLTATAIKVKSAQGSTSTYEAEVEEGDDVSYQWQYANTSTTADAIFTDIEGATSRTYTITADMLGKYLRVKAISNNTVVSTSKPYYGSTQSVAPVGPVQAAAGAVQLEKVALTSSLAKSMWVGATVTPTAMYIPENSYISAAVPQDAKVTYTWKVADSASGPFEVFDAADFPQSSVTASGELVIGADLAGKYVFVEANALMNTVRSLTWEILPQGVYDLMRITYGFDTLYSGNTIVTALQAKTLEYENDYSFGITVPVDDPYTSYQWYSTPDELDENATWTPIEGATDADLVIPASVVGNYVKVVATSSKDGVGTSVEKASTSRVLSGGSLQQAIEKMDFFHPAAKWGTATNMNDLVIERLASYGYTDVTVKTVACERSVEVDAAHVGVSVADDETNGDVEFFTYDGAAEASTHNFSIYHQVKLTFQLSREGEEPVEFQATTNIPWNLDAAKAIVDAQVEQLAIGYAEGDTAEAVTQNMSLPCKAGILWATWKSSNEDVVTVYRDESSGSALWDPYTGVVNRGADDANVVLKAAIDATLVDTADDTLASLNRTVEFPITVIGNAALIAKMNEDLAQVIDASFTQSALTDSRTGEAVDPDAITSDLQLPQTRPLFAGSELNSGNYKVVYSSDNEANLKVNGYRGVVVRPLPDAGDAVANLTITVTHRTMPDVKYTKTIPLKVIPLVEAEIDADIAYLEQVKESIFEGYSEGKQDKDAVVSDLHPFQRAYFTDEGELRWKYSNSDKSDAPYLVGFTPQTVEDNPSSDASYANFVSSYPGIVSDSMLHVTRATRDIGVNITCCLTSDRFGAYYERYSADPACPDELKEKLAKLYRQKIGCTITVKGTRVAAAALEELAAASDEAVKAKDGVVVSEDGSDVPEDTRWVDAATMKALEDAIVLAQAVAAKENATDAEVESAQATLAQAQAAFAAACKPGTCAYATPAQKIELAGAAEDAEALLTTVYSSADGKDVAYPKKWVPTAVADRLENAIAAAVAVASTKSIAASEVSSAAGELALARVAFERAQKTGLKDAPIDTVKVGKKYTAGSGKSKASYLVKSIATTSAEGTVWYAASKVSKKKGKAAVVPATVTIQGGTYRVVGISACAFKSMRKLTQVTIGKNVAKVSKAAFKNTKKLKKLVVKGTALSKKAMVKGALSGSKAAKLTVKVPKAFKTKAKKIFTKKNLGAPKKVTVK